MLLFYLSYSLFFMKQKKTKYYSWLLFKINEVFWMAWRGFFFTKQNEDVLLFTGTV